MVEIILEEKDNEMNNMKKILVVRNDKIGDFMVCFPAFAMLKQSLPDVEITALVPSYTEPLARLCPSIDHVIVDCADKKDSVAFKQLLNTIKAEKFDAMISFVSDWHNAKLAWQSGIKFRLAPATKIFQFLYNHRLTQRRSQSAKAESEYNLDLVRAFLTKQGIQVIEPTTPYLQFSADEIEAQKAKLAKNLQISTACKWLFVHSSTGGSASSLTLEQYAELINKICAQYPCEVILTAGKGESERAQQLAAKLHQKAAIYDKNEGLTDFSLAITCADLFIAGSTGPLHIAGALNVPTIGFYPSRLSAQPQRWRPINAEDRHLAFMPPLAKTKAEQMNLSIISISDALTTILPFIAKHWQM